MYFKIQGARKEVAGVYLWNMISLKILFRFVSFNGSGCDISLHTIWVVNNSYWLTSWPSKYELSNKKCKKKIKLWPISCALAACHAYTNLRTKELIGL